MTPISPINWTQPINRTCPVNAGLRLLLLPRYRVTGATFYDLASTNHATINTGVVYGSAISNWERSIDFATGFGLSVPSGFTIVPPFTICFRCVVPSGANATVFSQAAGTYELLFNVGTGATAGKPAFAPTAAVGADWSQAPSGQTTGSVQFYGLGYDGTTAYWYVNGSPIGTSSPATNNTSSATTLRVGCRANDSLELTTKLDFFSYHDRLLTAGGHAKLYCEAMGGFPTILNRRFRPSWTDLTAVPSFKSAWASGSNVLIGTP